MQCPNCGSAIPEEADYCVMCLERLEQDRSSSGGPDTFEGPPEEELQQIRAELAARRYVFPWERLRSTPREKAVAAAAGGTGSFVLAYMAGLLPVPFVGLLVPLPMGIFVGWMVKNRGGAWAMAVVGMPSAIGTLVAMRQTIQSLGKTAGQFLTYYYAAHLPLADAQRLPPSLVLGAAVVNAVFFVFAVAIPLLLAYWGGAVGERGVKGPGYGI